MLSHVGFDGVGGPFANLPALEVDAADPGLGREGNERGMEFVDVAAAQAVLRFRQHDDAATFRRFVGQRSKLCGIGQIRQRTRHRPAETPPPADCPA